MIRILLVCAIVALWQCGCSQPRTQPQILGFVPQDGAADKGPPQPKIQSGSASISLSGKYFNIDQTVTTNESLTFVIQKGSDPDGNKPAKLTHNFQAEFVVEPFNERPTRTVKIRFSTPLIILEELSYVYVWGSHPGVKTKRLIAVNQGSNYYVRVMANRDWVVNVGDSDVSVWAPPNAWDPNNPADNPTVLVKKGQYVEVPNPGGGAPEAQDYAKTEVEAWLQGIGGP